MATNNRAIRRMPAELWCMVFENLCVVDKASMSLVCRSFKNLFGPTHVKTVCRSREGYLSLLHWLFEPRNGPRAVLCPICMTWQKVEKPMLPSYLPWRILPPQHDCYPFQEREIFTFMRPFSWATLYLVMKNNRWGHPSNGLPIDTLGTGGTQVGRDKEFKWRWKSNTVANCSSRRLIVQVTFTLRLCSPVAEFAESNYIANLVMGGLACEHEVPGVAFGPRATRELELAFDNFVAGHPLLYTGTKIVPLARCGYCNSEYVSRDRDRDFKTKEKGSFKGSDRVFEIIRYVDLGTCLPNDLTAWNRNRLHKRIAQSPDDMDIEVVLPIPSKLFNPPNDGDKPKENQSK